MEESLRVLLAGVFNISPQEIQPDFAMRNYEQWDSLKHMELIEALEKGFDVEFDFDEIVRMQDLNSIKSVLTSRELAN